MKVKIVKKNIELKKMCHPCCCVQVAIPVYVRHSLNWLGGTQGRFDITVGPKQTMGRTVEKVSRFFN